MNYPDTAPANLSAFSPWQDALAASEGEMAMWAQLGEYAQPEPAVEGIPLDILDAVLACGPSRTTPVETFGLENTLSGNLTSRGTVAEGSSGHSVPLFDATAMGTMTSESAMVIPPIFTNDTHPYSQDFFFPQPDSSVSRTPSLTNGSALPSPQSDDPTNGLLGFPHPEAAPSYLTQQPGPSLPRFDIFGGLVPDPMTCAPPTWPTGGCNSAGQMGSNFGPLLDHFDNITYPTAWEHTQLTGHLAAPSEAFPTMATSEAVPSTSLGKRSRKRDEGGSGGQKKARPSATRVPGGTTSKKRTRRSPDTKTQQQENSTSKAAGRGAERLGSTTARGVYRQSLLGLSVPQGSMGALEHEEPSWIVGREQVETQRDTGSSAPQQMNVQENGEDGEVLHQIPGNLSERERSMLQMTQAERERGRVRTIKCKLCPEAQLGSWVTYKRHCNACERHPLELYFCSWCSDHFARPDSRTRHQETTDKACRNDDAMQKKEKIERLLKAFNARLTDCLKNEENIWPMFSEAMNRMLTNTSEEVSDTEKISFEGTWAAELC